MEKIQSALEKAKRGFKATEDSSWETPFYQYANRLAHLYFLAKMNKRDAYLLFLYFADAPDVQNPTSKEQWQGAVRVIHKSLGVSDTELKRRVGTVTWGIPEMLSA